VTHWPWDRTRALLLALVLGVAMSVASVQGGVMAAEMAVAAEPSGPCGCDGCSGDHDADISTCLSACGSASHGLLPGEPVALFSTVRADIRTARLVVGGRTTRPDHGPPKILTLG
jgi:hypothetical protein